MATSSRSPDCLKRSRERKPVECTYSIFLQIDEVRTRLSLCNPRLLQEYQAAA
jgi:hypothetical protein